jgi:CRISPR-associated protein Cas1
LTPPCSAWWPRSASSKPTSSASSSRTFLQALDQRREEEITHPVFGYKVSYRRAIELQARILARVIEGEADRYVALTTR